MLLVGAKNHACRASYESARRDVESPAGVPTLKFPMNPMRLIPLAFALTAPVCLAQLPPSILQPGKPVVPAPVVPTIPTAPAAESPAATPGSTEPNTLSAAEITQGWKLLFDGKRLIGMRGLQKADPLATGWKIQDGELFLPKDVKDMERMTGGDLVTMDFFTDFDFRFECKIRLRGAFQPRNMAGSRACRAGLGDIFQPQIRLHFH